MRVSQLILQNYRSYEDTELALEPGPNVLLGYNGVGKTNIAEAMGYLATLSSHRVPHDGPLIRHGHEQAIIRAAAHRGSREAFLELEINQGRSIAPGSTGKPGSGIRDSGDPADGPLRPGGPGTHQGLAGSAPAAAGLPGLAAAPWLAGVRQDYEKALKQRNALMKSIRHEGFTATHDSTLAVWDAQLSTAGARLLRARLDMLAALRPHTAMAYQELSQSVRSASMEYTSSLEREPAELAEAGEQDLAQWMQEALLSARSAERDRGVTLVGPIVMTSTSPWTPHR